MIEVRPVQSKQDVNHFLKLPFHVYRGQATKYPAWVPPFNMDVRHIFNRKHNYLYSHADLQGFLAWKNGSVLGRITATADKDFCKYQKTKTGFIGNFEAVDDQEVATALFSQAEAWLKQQGMERVIGPIDGGTNGPIGNQIDSFDISPVIQMIYAPPYYGALYEAAGYSKEVDLYSYRMLAADLKLSDKIERMTEIARKRHKIEVRTTSKREWNHSLNIVREIWDEAWADNWGYVPWNRNEFDQLADTLKMIVDLRVALFAYIGDEPVGFAFPIPNLNDTIRDLDGKVTPLAVFKLLKAKKTVKLMRIAAFGVRKKYHNKGIDALFIYELYKRGVANGYNASEFSWILEENLNLRNLLENWGAEHYRTHRIYEKILK